MIFSFKVSAFSKAILSEKYKTKPIKLYDNSIELQLLHYAHYPKNNKALRRLLKEEILIDPVNIQSYKWKFKRNYTFGYHLHSYHIQMMLDWIYAQRMITTNASKSLTLFNDVYKIDEDVISYEAQYKCWQRYWRKMQILPSQDYGKTKQIDVLKISIPYTYVELQNVFKIIQNDYGHFFKNQSGKYSKTFEKKLRLYLLGQYSNLSDQQLGEHFKLSIPEMINNFGEATKQIESSQALCSIINSQLDFIAS